MSHTARIKLGERKGKTVVVVCGECGRQADRTRNPGERGSLRSQSRWRHLRLGRLPLDSVQRLQNVEFL